METWEGPTYIISIVVNAKESILCYAFQQSHTAKLVNTQRFVAYEADTCTWVSWAHFIFLFIFIIIFTNG